MRRGSMTEKAPGAETASSRLYASWKVWCEQNGEQPGSNKALSQKLTDLGFENRRLRAGVTFRGIGLTAL